LKSLGTANVSSEKMGPTYRKHTTEPGKRAKKPIREEDKESGSLDRGAWKRKHFGRELQEGGRGK